MEFSQLFAYSRVAKEMGEVDMREEYENSRLSLFVRFSSFDVSKFGYITKLQTGTKVIIIFKFLGHYLKNTF